MSEEHAAKIAVLEQRVTALETRTKQGEAGQKEVRDTLTKILIRVEALTTRVNLFAAAIGTASGIGSSLVVAVLSKYLGG